MATEQKNIKVVVRVRPYNKRELEQNQRSIIKVMDSGTLLFDPDEEDDEFFYQGAKQMYRDITKRVNKKLSMEFDRIFDTEATNRQIFEECTAPLVDSVLNGYNCSVFVYGATGAGKTFTMLGSDSWPGLTFLTMRDLFDKIEAQSDTRKFDVGVSYLEVYNEQVMNLLTKTGPLKLREDSNGVVVSGLVLKPIFSAEELLELLALGNSHRTQHPTDANAESSRSHAVFQVHIRMTERKTGTKRTVKLSMIDLAGSERAASTKGIGVRFKEGASINKSLLALGNCINKLADGLKHIPYRDSNLTRILKDSLGGNCQTLMVANVSMSSLTYEDTYNTLKYASRAKKIRTTLRQNALKSNMPKDFYVRKVNELMLDVDRLRESNKQLESKLAQVSNSSNSRTYNEIEIKPWYSKIDAVYSSVIKIQEYVLGTQSKIKNLEIRNKMKEDSEKFNKILTLSNSNNLHEQYSRITASVTGLAKQVHKQKEELTRWRKKLHEAYKDLNKLKKEVRDCKYSDILQIQLRYKDAEIENSKKNVMNNHVKLINGELVNSMQHLRTTTVSALNILQRCYDSSQSLEPQVLQSLEELQQKLQTLFGTSIAFKDDYKKDSDEELDDGIESIASGSNIRVLVNGKRLNNSTEDDDDDDNQQATFCMRNKRLKFDNEFELDLNSSDDFPTDSDDDGGGCISGSVFKMPKTSNKLHNPNETHILSATDDECNSSSSSSISSILQKKKNLVTNILSEQITRVPNNKELVKNVLLKSKSFNHHGLLKTVATGVQKENKKYSPNRVRKSPRAVISKAFSSTASMVRKQIRAAGTISGNGDAPTVRINRAASLRVKK